MKTKIGIFTMCLCCLIFSSCAEKELQSESEADTSDNTSSAVDTVESSEVEKADTSEDSDSEAEEIYTMPDDYYVEYAVPDIINVPNSNIAAFNEMLNEKGYDFGIKLISVDYGNYSEELKTYSPDIAFIGFNDTDSDTVTQAIASGYYEPLNDYLENSVMYSQISSKLWDSVKYNGSIYTIPNCSAQDLPVSIVFNLEKISKETAEKFSGDISEIKDILGTGKLLYQINGFDFTEYYGYDHSKGVLVSQNKEVEMPYDSTECVEWLKTVNELYLNGSVTDDSEADWSICITKDVERISNENVFVYSPKAVITTRYSASTGILTESDNKDNSFKLLDLLHTDNDLANCLIYGTEYSEKDGYATDEKGEIMDSYVNKLIFGLDESLLWSENYLLHFSSYEEKLDYYNENVLESPAIDIQTDSDISDIQALLESNGEIWKDENLDEKLNSLKSAYDETNVKSVVSEIDSKIN
jgi:hypothetical protein